MRTSNSAGDNRSDSALAFAIRCFIDSLYFGSRFLVIAGVAFVGLLLVLLVILRFVNPPISSVMLQHWLAGRPVQQVWVPLTQISDNLQRAVVASEDAKFCRHPGLDLGELAYVMRQAHRNGSLNVRGASTITMQVSRNLFLWQGKSLLRKALEIAIAPMMEFVWPKRRILEVYLNIAEWGPGRFGAQTGALYHFNQPASRLNRSQATLMASALPNPRIRRPGAPRPALKRKARRLQARTKRLTPSMSCLNL
ncbi:MAG: monofunctional biosynthetic peptidoglycan transglycosylase [Pseudomonadota bacterium]